MAVAIVAGALANKAGNGGAAWTRLSWVLGLRKLGFDVCFVEQVERRRCVPEAVDYFARITRLFGLSGSAALVDERGTALYGLGADSLLDRADAVEVLVNITGNLTLPPIKRRARRAVYVDLDPGFTQFWHAAGDDGARLSGHDVYATVGENVGTPACSIPTGGIDWLPTRQPVVLEHWPVAEGGERERLTTVASWRAPYGSVEHDGRRYGLKVHEFRKFVALPEHVPQRVEIALDIHPAEERDLELLQAHGWHVVDPVDVVPDPVAFRSYVRASGGELSVAQGIYVETNSGWFSDRTTRFLASGKPALVQDTGFGRSLPVGEGLLAFRTLAEAVAGAKSIARNYEGHAEAARRLAEEHFDSDRVLGELHERPGEAARGT
jgi:hypothetical protein